MGLSCEHVFPVLIFGALGPLGCTSPKAPEPVTPAQAPPPAAASPPPRSTPAPTPLKPVTDAKEDPQSSLAAEQGVALGSSPTAFFDFCRSNGGQLLHSVTSNQGWAFCVNLPEPFVQLTGIYCGYALSDEAALCTLVHQGALTPKEAAESAASSWVTTLSSRLGEPSERGEPGAAWMNGERDILVSSGKDEKSDQWSVRVMYRSAEGRMALDPRRQDFPNGAGGFDFGSTAQEVKGDCTRMHGKFALTNESPAPGFNCIAPPIEPPINIQVVSGLFCAERVCEITLFMGERMNDLLLVFTAKYGAGTPTVGPAGQCRADVHKYSWIWAKGKQTTGWIRLTEDCVTRDLLQQRGWCGTARRAIPRAQANLLVGKQQHPPRPRERCSKVARESIR